LLPGAHRIAEAVDCRTAYASAQDLGASRRVNLPSIVCSILAPDRNRIKQSLSASVRQTAVDHTPLRRIGPPADVERLIPDLLEVTKLDTGACFRGVGGRFLGVDS
jgi:hypothetical protein